MPRREPAVLKCVPDWSRSWLSSSVCSSFWIGSQAMPTMLRGSRWPVKGMVALRNQGCNTGLNPPDSNRDLAM